MEQQEIIAEELPKDIPCLFVHWDFLDIPSNTIQCLFLTMAESELKKSEGIGDLIGRLYNKKGRRIVVQKKIEFILKHLPGNIFINDKKISSEKYFGKEIKLKNLEITDGHIISLQSLFQKMSGQKNYFYGVNQFNNSYFYRVPSSHPKYDYILFPLSEVLRRFFLPDTYSCREINGIALHSYDIEETEQDGGINSFETYGKSLLYSKLEVVRNKDSRTIQKVNIKLNKNISDEETYFWTRFVLTPKYRKSLNQAILGLRNESEVLNPIIAKWPESPFVDVLTAYGWEHFAPFEQEGEEINQEETKKGICYFFVSELKACSDTTGLSNVPIFFDRDNRNEKVPNSTPKERKKRTIKGGERTNTGDDAKGQVDKPEEKVREKVLSRDYMLPEGNTAKIEKEDQKTTGKDVKSQKNSGSGIGGGGSNYTGTNTDEDNKNSIQNVNYLNWIEDIKDKLYEDNDVTIINTGWSNFVDTNDNIPYRTILGDSKKYGFTLSDFGKLKNSVRACYRNKNGCSNSRKEDNKRLRRFHYVIYHYKGRKNIYIELESISTSFEVFWILKGEIEFSTFVAEYINRLHYHKTDMNKEVSRVVRENHSVAKYVKHPKHYLNEGDNASIDKIKNDYIKTMIGHLKD